MILLENKIKGTSIFRNKIIFEIIISLSFLYIATEQEKGEKYKPLYPLIITWGFFYKGQTTHSLFN